MVASSYRVHIAPVSWEVAKTVKERFVQQCSRFSSIVIQVPALAIPRPTDDSSYDFDRSKHPVAIQAKALSTQIDKAAADMETCFKSVSG
jgi:hypothetical protein